MVVLALTQKNLSFYGDRSCQYPEESIMKAAVDSFLGLHRRIQHLVDTPELLGPPVRYRSMIRFHHFTPRRSEIRGSNGNMQSTVSALFQLSNTFYYPENGAEYKYLRSEDKFRSIVTSKLRVLAIPCPSPRSSRSSGRGTKYRRR